MRAWVKLALTAILGACLVACSVPPGPGAGPQASGTAAASLAQRLEQLRSKYALNQVWFRVEIPGRAPMQAATTGDPAAILPVASVSKSVTAIGVALLIQQGRLSLDTTLGQVLSPFFQQRGQTLDPSLVPVTVERLLTHRAGLQANGSTDPVNGLSSATVIRRAGADSDFFNYVAAIDGAKSNGSSEFVYSNISYLLLGLVIEAVTGERYVDFIQREVLRPLGVTDAVIPANYTLVSPYAGWHMSLADVLRAWETFDVAAPKVLRRETLERTLLGHLGRPINAAGTEYYTLGVNVLQPRPGAGYVVNHNGIADFMRGEPKVYTFVEKLVPGTAWDIVYSSGQRDVGATERRNINFDVRAMVKDLEAAR